MAATDDQNSGARSRLLTLVFTDLVNSVGLKSRLGDAEAGRLIAAHQQAMRGFIAEDTGREILVAGDGCFITFETPSEAVHFALNLQDHHRRNPSLPAVRVGIHMGEVTERKLTDGSGRPLDVEGLAVDIASRIQAMAEPRQILLSYPVFDNARQRLDSARWPMPVEWQAHGRYTFKGTEMSLEIFEVGLKGVAPFTPPEGGAKAHRDVHEDEEQTLGWRPAQGLPLPGRPNWEMLRKLGEGGFGDVWLVGHTKTNEQHVVKFCYSADRLRTLKREVTLFRLLKETLGSRPDIARLLDYHFESQPYYLEIEYAGDHTLASWLDSKGSPTAIPLETRLDLVAQIAEAVAAAHSIGVLHKDIKPSNVMVREELDGNPQIKMIDFGIGALEDTDLLHQKGITATGLTETGSSSEYGSSLSGTRLYMAPELLEGKPATTKSDIYSLGVLLYQMVTGRLGQTLAPGWERDVDDELLRQDIAACVDGLPENRLKAAEELAWRLRHLPERHEAAEGVRELQRQEVLRKQRNRRMRLFAVSGAAAMLLLLSVFALYAYLQSQKAASEAILRRGAENARELAEAQQHKAQAALARAQQARYFASIALAEASLRESRYEIAQEVLLDDPPENLLRREWGWLLAQTAPEDFAIRNKNFFDAKFLPHDNQFVIASREVQGSGYLAFHDLATAGLTTRTVTNDLMVWNVDVSADGRYAATASRDLTISIVDVAEKKVVQRLSGHTGIVRDARFSHDGRFVATCARDNTMRIWPLDNPSDVRVIPLEKDSPTELSLSPDSAHVVVGSLEGNVRVFSTTSGTQVCKLAGVSGRVLSVCFMANGRGIAAGDSSGATHLFPWPPPPGQMEVKPYLSVPSVDTYPTQVASSPDGESVFVGNDNGQVTKLNAKTGVQEYAFTVDQPLWKISLSRDGKRLLTTSRWSVRLIDLERLDDRSTVTAMPSPLEAPHDAIPLRAATVFRPRDQTWRGDLEWRTTSGLSLVTTSRGSNYLVNSEYVVYSPDKAVAIKINPETLRWRAVETTSGKTLHNMKRHLCVGAVFSPDGKRVAVLYEKERTIVYSTRTWTPLYVIPCINSPVSAVFTADSRRLLIGDFAGVITEHSAFTGKQLRQFRDKGTGMPLSMALSSDGEMLAAGLDQDRAVVINLETGDQVSTMSGHVRYIHAVQFSPDNQRLTTLSRDGTVKMWDVPTGRELVTLFNFKNGVLPLGISFGSNGRTISVVTSDSRVVTTEVFPWNLEAYGDSDAPLAERIELWKRRVRLNPKGEDNLVRRD